MKVIILAGGKGTRLPESTKNVPKPLVDVGKREILKHQLDLLAEAGLTEVRFSLGHRAEQIIPWLGDKYEYVVEEEPLDTGGAVKFAAKDLTEPFVVTNGDILANIDLSKMLKRFHDTGRQVITVRKVEDARDFGLVETDADGHITAFKEKPQELMPGLINAGFYILDPEKLRQFPEKKFSIERAYFPELVRQNALTSFVHDGFWFDCGTEARLAEARKFFETQKSPIDK